MLFVGTPSGVDKRTFRIFAKSSRCGHVTFNRRQAKVTGCLALCGSSSLVLRQYRRDSREQTLRSKAENGNAERCNVAGPSGVSVYEPAATDIDAFFSQYGLDGRTIIARRITPADRCVGSESEVIPNAEARRALEAFAQDMGSRLWAEYPLGWPPGALLVAFPHDVPNNALPLLWKASRRPPWRPLISGVSTGRRRPS